MLKTSATKLCNKTSAKHVQTNNYLMKLNWFHSKNPYYLCHTRYDDAWYLLQTILLTVIQSCYKPLQYFILYDVIKYSDILRVISIGSTFDRNSCNGSFAMLKCEFLNAMMRDFILVGNQILLKTLFPIVEIFLNELCSGNNVCKSILYFFKLSKIKVNLFPDHIFCF